MTACSICGDKKAVCLDQPHKGTYWLCGLCAGERIEELIAARARIEELEAEVRGLGRLLAQHHEAGLCDECRNAAIACAGLNADVDALAEAIVARDEYEAEHGRF